MAIRRHTSRSTVSINNRVNSANLAFIFSGTPVIVEYLVVAGGGGGGGSNGGGGGAGGLIAGSLSLYYFGSSYKTYTITVGAAGSGGVGYNTTAATQGGNSLISALGISDITASGGGYGATEVINGAQGTGGGNGGSGGGGNGYYISSNTAKGKGVYLGSTYLNQARQGYDGGSGTGTGTPNNYRAGGGGGASAAGADGSTSPSTSGNGGAGYQWVNNLTYAGGGGGGGLGGTAGTGGAGGGGNGSVVGAGSPGSTNTGGGGGGGTNNTSGAAGGSGIVIVRWPNSNSSANANTGSNVLYTNTGGYHTYRFYSSGTITF